MVPENFLERATCGFDLTVSTVMQNPMKKTCNRQSNGNCVSRINRCLSVAII